MLENLTRDDFAAQINTKFRVYRESDSFEVELVEVTKAKVYQRQGSFSLLFLMPEDFSPVQGNYLFKHEKMGSAEIFVVPIEKESRGIIFEAVFNRIAAKS